MTRNLFFLILCLLFFKESYAQKTWEGDLQTKQFEQFKAENYSTIRGNLEIKNSNLTNLEQLYNLIEVQGNLNVFNNDSLTSLDGLQNLILVGGKISIRENKHLNNYCALSKELLLNGITGEEVNKNIFDRFDTQDNEYDPDRMDLIDGDCEYYSPLYYFSL